MTFGGDRGVQARPTRDARHALLRPLENFCFSGAYSGAPVCHAAPSAMIYDVTTSALYADDGTFLHTVHCPMALTPDQLEAIYPDSTDRHCRQCKRRIFDLDRMSDVLAKALFLDDPHACVFSTGRARHIVFLHHREQREGNARGLPVIRTARNLQMMQAASRQGFRPLLRDAAPAPEEGEFKYIVYQHQDTGEIWWSGDRRDFHPLDHPLAADDDPWVLVKDWFFVRADQPFPLAAYLIPRDLPDYTPVFVEDVIEDWRELTWNQGNSRRIHATEAMWTGQFLMLGAAEQDDSPPCRVG